ncbi:unnamed protein product [Rhizophagus irregularis]|nr:unnamed protein product [Rhizophagus irregularis]
MDNTIIAHEKEIEKLKSEISDLRKQLRVLQQDKKFKDEVESIQDGRIIELENKGVGTPMQNPANVIDGIRGSLNTIRVTLQNITTKRDQYQNILNDTNNRERNLRNQLRDSRNQNLRFQRFLDES